MPIRRNAVKTQNNRLDDHVSLEFQSNCVYQKMWQENNPKSISFFSIEVRCYRLFYV